MTKKEFQKGIQKARESVYMDEAVCWAIDYGFTGYFASLGKARQEFNLIFRPYYLRKDLIKKGVNGERNRWLGYPTPENTELRHFFLDAFEAYCLSSLSDYAYRRF